VRTGPHDREILRLAIPALGALIAEPLYVLADTAVVGHIGTAELGGLAVASSVLLTGYAIFIFLAYGTTGAVGRLIGAGDRREAAHQAVQSLWLALLIAAVLVPSGLLGAGWLVRALGARGAIATNAEVYLRISLFGVPALLLMLAGTGYLRGRQDTRTPLLVALLSNVVNLGLELLLIYGLGYGIGASALATVIAQWGAAAVYVAYVARAARDEDAGVRPDRAALAGLGRAGAALLVRTAALRGSLTAATAVAAHMGAVELAAHQIAFELWNSLALALDAIAIAGQAMMGRALGAGAVDEARAVSRRMVELGVGAGFAFGLIVFATRPLLPHLFSNDRAVVTLAGFVLVWVAVLQPVNAVAFVLDGVLIGAGDLRYLAWAMAGAAAVFAVAAGAVYGLGLGIGWLWAAMGAFMVARVVGLWLRFRTETWLVTGATLRSGVR
jgi:putative MATE family efflux protein